VLKIIENWREAETCEGKSLMLSEKFSNVECSEVQ